MPRLGSLTRFALTATLGATSLAIVEQAACAHSSSAELVRMARAHEEQHEDDVAVRRYMEALSVDPTCEAAYLGLGELRLKSGDLREAERVYSVAVEHIPGSRAARLGRARVQRSLGNTAIATHDLLTGSGDALSSLRTLAGWHAEDGHLPAELAVWRKIAALAAASRQTVALREARTMVRALVLLVGPADPAAAPPDARGDRCSIAVIARRGE